MSSAPVVVAEGLSRSFRVPVKEPGAGGALRHFFRRRYTDVAAVSDVSFSIAPGEFVGFLGANGAGKTTTLKMLTGLLVPSTGRAVVDGQVPFARTSTFLRGITLVMGNKQQLMWDLPARDSFRMNAAIYGIDDDTMARRIDELAAMLDVADLLDRPVRKLSLGERMKAELLASLLHRPRVLFLDEPTLGLDVNAQVAVRAFLKRYNEATGATTILTSHYMQDITALCPRVLVMHEGRLIHDGTLAALLQRLGQKKEIRLDLARDWTSDALRATCAPLSDLLELVQHEGRVARFRVEPAALRAVLPRLLEQIDVVDLAVQDPPIEDVIGRALTGDLSRAGASAVRA